MTIQQNESNLDRFSRIIIGGAGLIIPSYVQTPTIVVFILMLIGLYLMFSGLSGHCVFYRLMGINTCK
ncbi:MAG: DUF2892 domain-containing protein [Candidatus Margulisiibacteriota bacterium]